MRAFPFRSGGERSRGWHSSPGRSSSRSCHFPSPGSFSRSRRKCPRRALVWGCRSTDGCRGAHPQPWRPWGRRNALGALGTDRTAAMWKSRSAGAISYRGVTAAREEAPGCPRCQLCGGNPAGRKLMGTEMLELPAVRLPWGAAAVNPSRRDAWQVAPSPCTYSHTSRSCNGASRVLRLPLRSLGGL